MTRIASKHRYTLEPPERARSNLGKASKNLTHPCGFSAERHHDWAGTIYRKDDCWRDTLLILNDRSSTRFPTT